MSKAVPVLCSSSSCGWRGRRIQGDCACYDEWAMSCRCSWGSCPKCGGRVETVAFRQMCKRSAASAEAWLASPDGQATMAELNKLHGGARVVRATEEG
jgi:hypothetical protein